MIKEINNMDHFSSILDLNGSKAGKIYCNDKKIGALFQVSCCLLTCNSNVHNHRDNSAYTLNCHRPFLCNVVSS